MYHLGFWLCLHRFHYFIKFFQVFLGQTLENFHQFVLLIKNTTFGGRIKNKKHHARPDGRGHIIFRYIYIPVSNESRINSNYWSCHSWDKLLPHHDAQDPRQHQAVRTQYPLCRRDMHTSRASSNPTTAPLELTDYSITSIFSHVLSLLSKDKYKKM